MTDLRVTAVKGPPKYGLGRLTDIFSITYCTENIKPLPHPEVHNH